MNSEEQWETEGGRVHSVRGIATYEKRFAEQDAQARAIEAGEDPAEVLLALEARDSSTKETLEAVRGE